jgi:hypothetical protein
VKGRFLCEKERSTGPNFIYYNVTTTSAWGKYIWTEERNRTAGGLSLLSLLLLLLLHYFSISFIVREDICLWCF